MIRKCATVPSTFAGKDGEKPPATVQEEKTGPNKSIAPATPYPGHPSQAIPENKKRAPTHIL